MSSTNYSFAPYNFFPFTEEVKQSPSAYDDYESLPPHDSYVEGRLTGEITYRVTALQEMRIGGGEEVNGVKTIFRDGRGRCVIPGSTMRGFVRSHAEMLSFSYPEMIDDTRFSFRSFASNCATLRKQYAAVMSGNNLQEKETEKGTVKNVRIGYLYCRRDGSGSKRYYIVPVREFGDTGCTCFKVHEATLYRAGVLKPENRMYRPETWKQNFGRRKIDREMQNKYYLPYRRNDSIHFDYEDGKIVRVGDWQAQYEGRLLNSGFIGGKTHHYLVSAIISDTDKPWEISDDVKDIYYREVEQNSKKLGRNDFARDKQKDTLREIKKFYELPKDTPEPNSMSDKEYAMKHGKLFFYRIEGDQVAGFGPTPYFRVPYKHSVAEGIQYRKPQGYDYVNAMFGFISNKKSYKGRVSFQNAVEEDRSDVCERTLLTGASPRASAIQLYLQQKGTDTNTLSTYNDSQFRLRGQKFYWKRANTIKPFDSRERSNQNNSLQFVRANSSFCGKILFQNLSGEELGLLLLAIQYKNPATENRPERFLLGGGKAYGYGLIELSDVKLSLFDLRKSFAQINPTMCDQDSSANIVDYKKRFVGKIQAELHEKYGIQSYEDTATIRTYKRYGLMSAKDAEKYLQGHDTGYMPVSAKRDSGIVSYGSKLPLQTAEALMNEWSV